MFMKRTAILSLILGTVLTGAAALPAFADNAPSSGIKDFDAESLIKTDGTYWVWGGNHPVPTQVPGLSDVTASFVDGIVMKKDLSVWHWEYTNATTVAAEAIPALHDLSTVFDSGHDLIALEQNGDVYTIPRTEEGQLNWNAAAPVNKIQDISAVTSYYTNPEGKLVLLFLKKDGTLWSSDRELQSFTAVKTVEGVQFVEGNYALLADGTVQVFPALENANWVTVDPSTVTLMQPLQDIQFVLTNGFSNAAVDKQHRLWFWGNTLTGFSDGTVLHEQKAPILMKGVDNIKDVFFVERSLVVLTGDGKVYETSLGNESLPADAKFRLLASDISKVEAGGRHIIMQTNAGAMWGWGINKLAEQGTGDYDYMHEAPVPMQPPVTVELNGQPVALSNGVIIRHAQAFIPLRSVFEQLGAKVTWDETRKTVTITQLGSAEAAAITIMIDFAKGTTAVNGKTAELDTTPFNISGTSYLPLRFISESLGAHVEWIKQDNRIAITK